MYPSGRGLPRNERFAEVSRWRVAEMPPGMVEQNALGGHLSSIVASVQKERPTFLPKVKAGSGQGGIRHNLSAGYVGKTPSSAQRNHALMFGAVRFIKAPQRSCALARKAPGETAHLCHF